MVERADIAVVGAGPSGAAAAIAGARAGLGVVLVDRAAFPRDKYCGDGLTAAALRELEELGLDPAEVPSWRFLRSLAIRSPGGRWVDLELPDDEGWYAAVARRTDLDAAVLDLARAAGAKVHDGRGVTGAHLGADRVTLDTTGETVEARYLVGADGMWSPTRRFLGTRTEGYRGEWHAFRQYYRDVTTRAATTLVVWFEPDILPGYAWSFPLGDGHVNVGFGIVRGGRHRTADMRTLWPDILARSHVREVLGDDATPDGPHRAWPIPARVDRTTLARGRALWVGDAAAAVDPMTGEGIAQALETGRWAVESIVAAGPWDAGGARSGYERAVRQGLVTDHRLSRTLMRALGHRKGTRFPLWLVDRSDWTRRNFARWMWEDYPRAVLATPRRWHRGMLAGPGAYRGAPYQSGLAA
ncbi:MAG: geranylgeranyl reductase family protein [Acidimicrobiia bacterium]|nr:geranylgeranyl reductase family protein [Acidimicrobiia bacterium]